MSTAPNTGPLIGITADSEDGGAAAYSKFPWYAVRENYCGAVKASGGIPLMLPHQQDLIDTYADMLAGLVITGGAFDVHPSLFGADDVHDTVVLKEGRTDFELGITKAMLERDKPVFGICGGQQLLAVALGGTLIQHIPDEVDNPLPHEQPNPRDEPGHEVRVTPGTLLHDLTGEDTFAVNSAHHQAVKEVSDNLTINAIAPDGVIEGIEDAAYSFCLGVQWHPEFHITSADKKIFDGFIAACDG